MEVVVPENNPPDKIKIQQNETDESNYVVLSINNVTVNTAELMTGGKRGYASVSEF